MRNKGFTLIELMIVVAIIGILAVVAIPLYANAVKKAKEGATKGGLSALRSAIKIYYSDHEGIWPSQVAGATASDNLANLGYIDQIPKIDLGEYHAPTTSVGTALNDDGDWNYQSSTGEIYVDCTHSDTKGDIISSW